MKTEGGNHHFPNLRLMFSGGGKGLQSAVEGGDVVPRVVLLEKSSVRAKRGYGEVGGKMGGGIENAQQSYQVPCAN